MAGVTAGHTIGLNGRLACGDVGEVGTTAGQPSYVGREPRLAPVGATGPQFCARFWTDESGSLARVLWRQQRLDRDVPGVAVPSLTVGEGELERLDLRVNPLRRRGVERIGVVQRGQSGERLEEDWALPPGLGLGDREAVPLQGDGFLPACGEGRHVGAGDEPGVATAAGIAERPPGEVLDCLGDEALTPRFPGRIDLGLTVRPGGVGL